MNSDNLFYLPDRLRGQQLRLFICILLAVIIILVDSSKLVLIPVVLCGLLLLLIIAGIILTNPKSALFILLIFDFFIYSLGNEFNHLLPPHITWFSDAILCLLFIAVIVMAIKRGYWKSTCIDAIVLITIATIIISAIVNHTDILSLILGLRFYLKFPLFYIFLINLDLSPQVYNTYKKWFLILVLLQIPFTIFEFFLLGWSADLVGGTLGRGATSQMGLSIVFGQCAFLIAALYSTRNRLRNLLLVVLLLIPPILGSVNGNFIFLIGLVGFLMMQQCLSRGGPRRLWIVLLLILPLLGGLKVYEKIDPDNLTALILENPGVYWDLMWTSDLNTGASFNRLVQIPASFRETSKNVGTFLVGDGPYSFSDKSKIIGDETQSRELQMETGIGINQITRTLLELGMLGLCTGVFLMGALWRLISRYIRQAAGEEEIVLGRTVQLMWVFFACIGIAYGPIWAIEHTAGFFWVWVASLTPGT
jgi:hypothetical protein